MSQFHVATLDTPTVSTNDMDTIATAFPALKCLAISNLLMAGGHKIHLKPLSRLTSLRALSIKSDAMLPDSLLSSLACLKGLARLELTLIHNSIQAILPHLQHVSSLASLSFGLSNTILSGGLGGVISHLSCLSGQQHLTCLAFPKMRHNERKVLSVNDARGLTGCKQLASLLLPSTVLSGEVAELLASELPRLKLLAVHSLAFHSPMVGPCGWKVLALRGLTQDLGSLLQLPLGGPKHLRLQYRALSLDAVHTAGAEALISRLELSSARLAGLLKRAAQAEPSGPFYLDLLGEPIAEPGSATRLIAALGPLDGVILALQLGSAFKLERGRLKELAAALPHLQVLDFRCRNSRPPDISDCAWSCIGQLPRLQVLILGDAGGGFLTVTVPLAQPLLAQPAMQAFVPQLQWQHSYRYPFQPKHMELLVSSLRRPLVVIIADNHTVAAALAGIATLQAAQHEGVRFVRLKRLVGAASAGKFLGPLVEIPLPAAAAAAAAASGSGEGPPASGEGDALPSGIR